MNPTYSKALLKKKDPGARSGIPCDGRVAGKGGAFDATKNLWRKNAATMRCAGFSLSFSLSGAPKKAYRADCALSSSEENQTRD